MVRVDVFDTSAGVTWPEGFSAVLRSLKRWVNWDAAVLALTNPASPLGDECLAAVGVQPVLLGKWYDGGYREDPLLKAARRAGLAAGRSGKTQPGPPIPAMHAISIILAGSGGTNRHAWYLTLGRKSQAFDEREQGLARTALRYLQSGFDHPVEQSMGRLILGSDARLIHADPLTSKWFYNEPNTLPQLRALLPAIAEQRWPEGAHGRVHDLALNIADRNIWLRFRRDPILDPSASPWYVELRPLDPNDLPPVGLVDDDRVARAMGYLSDHFAESPSLNETAERVGTSPFHFHRLFSNQAGISPKHYVLRTQLQAAKWMLRAGRLPIGQIADATGFASHGHFTATFHRLVGQSPTDYRESR